MHMLASACVYVLGRFSAMAKGRELLRDAKYSECIALVRAARSIVCVCVCVCVCVYVCMWLFLCLCAGLHLWGEGCSSTR